jgi:hypothetical protein
MGDSTAQTEEGPQFTSIVIKKKPASEYVRAEQQNKDRF